MQHQEIKETKEYMLISYKTMRKAVGWLGMLLPFALLLLNYFINETNLLNNNWFVKTECQSQYEAQSSWKSSISHYYYTTVGELFTGTLCAVALFMFSYKGFPKNKNEKGLSDSLMTNLAGAFALGVVLFPTSSSTCISDNIRSFLSSDNTGYIHLTSAALFFVTLAFMSIINFRRTETVGVYGQTPRDKLYFWCGIAMFLCLALLVVYIAFFEGWFMDLHPVFSLEALALQAFGLSWLTKGGVDFYFIPKLFGMKRN